VGLVAFVASVMLAFQRPLVGVPLALATGAAEWFLLRLLRRREVEDEERRTARLRAIAPPEGAAWRALLAAEGLGSLTDRLAPQVRPAIRLETAREPTQPGHSHIGGLPDLPGDMEWPRRKGKPLPFVAQVDLAEAQRAHASKLLPESGWLLFFSSEDDAEHGSCVLYLPAGAALDRRALPDGLSPVYQECAIRFFAYEDIPDPPMGQEWDDLDLEDEQFDSFFRLRDYLSSGGKPSAHKLLGHAQPVQGPLEPEWEQAANGAQGAVGEELRPAESESRSRDWLLLLQLDTDDAASMMWGDAGKLYFGIREADLRERLFERARAVLQCA
jgi:uncharacterized protein YwqG